MDEGYLIGQGKFTIDVWANGAVPAVCMSQCRWEAVGQSGPQLEYDEGLSYEQNEYQLGSDVVCVKLEDVDALIVKLLAVRAQMEGQIMGSMQGGPWVPLHFDWVKVAVDTTKAVYNGTRGELFIDRDYIDTFVVKLLAAANGNEEETT